MIRLSVVIPYYQRESGILRRALTSILGQRLPASFSVHVIVVDDGSPVSAQSEVKSLEQVQGLAFAEPFSLQIIEQPNAGVVVARNTALQAIDESTRYVAFLDSDDSWLDGHLLAGIEALESGNDLYFCDNEREGFHDSHFAADTAMIMPYIEKAGDAEGLITLGRDEIATLILRNFPCQISTAMYRREVAPELIFDTSVKNAGEDVLFFLMLVGHMQKVCFSPRIMVHCGSGINLYFGSFDWESAGYLRRLIDNMKAHQKIKKTIVLSPDNVRWNDAYIADHRRKIAYHTLRRFVKNKGIWPPEIKVLAGEDKGFALWFPLCALQVLLGRAFGYYKPV